MSEAEATRSIDSVLQEELGIFPVWMSPEAKLLAIFIKFVEPTVYDGASAFHCMVYQTCREIGDDAAAWNAVAAVSEWSGVDQAVVGDIYDEMARTRYSNDYRASIERSAEILRVDLAGVLALFDGQDNYTRSANESDREEQP